MFKKMLFLFPLRVSGAEGETDHRSSGGPLGRLAQRLKICRHDLAHLFVILSAVLVIGVAHHLVPHSSLIWHNVFQWLYYIPVVVAAIRFGLLGGMMTACVAVIGYFPHFLMPPEGYPADYTTVQYAAAALLLSMSAVTGALADRERRRRDDLQRVTDELRRTHEELQCSFDQLRQADRLAAVGELAAGLAHEIRNPLAGIRGAVGVLEQPHTPDAICEEFRCIIRRESDRLEKLLTNVLEFARSRPPEYQTVDVGQQLDAVIRLLAKTASQQGITLGKDIAQDTPPLECDANQLQQVILNLVLNAIQATPMSGGSVTLAARREDSNMLIQVADQGCGVAGDLEAIFQPFHTTKEHGTGLGLAVSRRIVAQHGGTLTAQRNAAAGMTFSVVLPLRATTRNEGARVMARTAGTNT